MTWFSDEYQTNYPLIFPPDGESTGMRMNEVGLDFFASRIGSVALQDKRGICAEKSYVSAFERMCTDGRCAFFFVFLATDLWSDVGVFLEVQRRGTLCVVLYL